MLRKLIFSVLAIFAGFSSTAALAEQPSGYFINTNLIPLVVCIGASPDGQVGIFSGTAAYIGDNKFITAEHVVHGMTECRVNGKVLVRSEDNVALDYAIFSLLDVTPQQLPQEVLNFSCTPFKKEETYLAVGYALGHDLVVQRLTGSRSTTDSPMFAGATILVGNTFTGMSGGPIFNDRGQIVGIVNGGDRTGRANMVSRSLLETSLCR